MNFFNEMIYEKFLKACKELNIKPTDARWKKYKDAYYESLKNKIRNY